MSLANGDPAFDEIVEDFLNQLREGKNPSIEGFAKKHPNYADRIRELFLTLIRVEGIGDGLGGGQDQFDSHPPQLDNLADYKIMRELGRGGMGIVYEAEQRSLDRLVALKVLPSPATSDKELLRRFQTEAQAAASLQHPNIVSVHGVGEDNGVHFIAMQLIDGVGLDEILQELKRFKNGQEHNFKMDALSNPSQGVSLLNSPMSDANSSISEKLDSSRKIEGRSKTSQYHRNVARIGIQASNALAHAHDQGVIHRDIKPSNLMLDSNANLWVTDFGLAKLLDDGHQSLSANIVGTIRYMAPERFSGLADSRSDVYSLGITLYEMLTHTPAFPQQDRAHLIQHIHSSPPPKPRQIDPKIPKDLETIVLKSMAPESTKRYQTASQLSVDLNRFLEGRPIYARRTSTFEQIWLWCNRNSLVAGMLGLVISSLMASTISLWVANRHAKKNLDRATSAEQSAVDNEQISQRNLFESLVSQAALRRLELTAGRRRESIQAIQQATQIAKNLELGPKDFARLRGEAVSSFELMDAGIENQWPAVENQSRAQQVAFDSGLEKYARLEAEGIAIRNVNDNQLNQRLPLVGSPSQPPCLRFSPDGKLLATIGKIHRPTSRSNGSKFHLTLFDIESGAVKWQTPAHFKTHETAIDFSADSQEIFFVDPEFNVCGLHTHTGDKREICFGGSKIECLRKRPFEEQLAISIDSEVRIIALETGKNLYTEKRPVGRPRGLGWSPDGMKLAISAINKVWILTLKNLEIEKMQGSQNHLTFNVFFDASGKYLASSTLFATTIWSMTRLQPVLKIPRNSVAFSARKFQIGWGNAGSTIGTSTLSVSEPVRRFEDPSNLWSYSIEFSPDNQLIAEIKSNRLTLYDLKSNRKVLEIPQELGRQTGFELDGNRVWTISENGLMRWNLRKGRLDNLIAKPMISVEKFPEFSRDSRFSNDGNLLVSPNSRGVKAIVYDLSSPVENRISPVILNHSFAKHIAIDPGNKWIATGTLVGRDVCLWERRSGKLLKRLKFKGEAKPCFSSCGKFLAINHPLGFLVCKTESWETLHELERKSADFTGPVAFSPDSSMLVIGSSQSIQFITTSKWETIADVRFLNSNAFSFSRDGLLFGASSRHKVIQVWDFNLLRQELRKLELDW